MRMGSKPALAICHCTPPAVSSERSQRRVALGSGSFSSVRIRPRGIRASSTPPPLDDVEAHDRARRRPPRRRCSARMICEPGLKPRKSTSTSIRSAGCSGKPERATGASSSPPSDGDLQHLAALAQPEVVRAGVGGVEEAQPVDPPLDRHARRDRAVDQQRVAAEAEVDVLGVAERAVLVERVVGQHQRHVELAAAAARARPRARRRSR